MPWSRSVRTKPRSPNWLTARPYAHRGLHRAGIVENSRAAFEVAIAAGMGIELDVRLSRCGTPFVFHDAQLDRLCGAPGVFAAMDAGEIDALRLTGSDQSIPTLEQVLELVDGRVPLLIELKIERGARSRLCAATASLLREYSGPAAAMSFDPLVAAWFRRHAPEIIRGIVISEQGHRNLKVLRARALALILTRPDFLAYDIRSLPSGFAARARSRGLPILTWTVRTPDERRRASLHADQIIQELPADT